MTCIKIWETQYGEFGYTLEESIEDEEYPSTELFRTEAEALTAGKLAAAQLDQQIDDAAQRMGW